MTTWPLQSQCDQFYGNPRGPGGSVVSPAWYQENIVSLTPQFAMHMGNIPITHFPVHKKCQDSFKAWLEAVWNNAGKDPEKIALWGMDVFSGSFNYRVMRTSNHLSMHSYGAAIDIDAPRNGQGSGAGHFSTLKNEVVQPFLDLGGTWGGNWHGSTQDSMHFQFATLG